MGIAPLRFLVEECVSCGIEVYAYLSAKQESFLFHAELFRSMGVTVRETTNPYANVTDFLRRICRMWSSMWRIAAAPTAWASV